MKQVPVTTSVVSYLVTSTPTAIETALDPRLAIRPGSGYHISKRLFDLVVGTLLLVVLAVAMVVVGMLIVGTEGWPIFYTLEAVGKDGKRFRVYKFRTMRRDADAYFAARPDEHVHFRREMKLPQDPRVHRIGRWLRRASIDELPQILNVLRGEMSLVGPRYVRPEELALYGEFAQERLTMVPGITGLWQISGRNAIPYQQRIILDRTYYYTRTFLGDVSILLRTLPAVLRGKGAY
jgi:exopolysaccharide production protein ExoY